MTEGAPCISVVSHGVGTSGEGTWDGSLRLLGLGGWLSAVAGQLATEREREYFVALIAAVNLAPSQPALQLPEPASVAGAR